MPTVLSWDRLRELATYRTQTGLRDQPLSQCDG